MSGIYIKGMEMPKDGTFNIVHIYSDGHVSMPFLGKGMQTVQGIHAVPVPPHGRLIDVKSFETMHFTDVMYDAESKMFVPFVEVASAIFNAPTIIPAEEGGDTNGD